jgi:tripartite ATP-independent transporter DctP family solute receptor
MSGSKQLTRRSFVAGVAIGSAAILVKSLRAAFVRTEQTGLRLATRELQQRRAADYTFVQYHNQTATSSLHQRLVEMWNAIRTETGGRVDTQVFPENRKTPGSDPAALKMLVSGEIQFFTLMGGLLSSVVPVADVQQVPYSFRSASEAHQAMDGALGAYLRQEMTAKGIHGFPVGAFDNGMRQIGAATRPIVAPDDLVGIRMRIPAGQLFDDMFRAFGAQTVVVNSDSIYGAFKAGRVDAQENPLALVDLFKIYDVIRYVSMTNHMWSGFNLLAHLSTWQRLPDDIKVVIERNAAKYVRLQRQDQENMNARLRAELERRGLVFNDVDPAPFRAKLSGLYATWKERLGARCWSLLEAEVGRLG